MKKLLAICLVSLCTVSVQAADAPDIKIERRLFGSGEQTLRGLETSKPVGDLGVQHVPQYLPGSPTSATIYPHVVDVPCAKGTCQGYTTNIGEGRGEYKFFRPNEVGTTSK